ncbi:unnamed protein product [Phaedon cochleariae]|uniref:C2 domain-containing protein n=1 Tax=Phaedon cochleariae TaxID=80249 RepID=A0A9P0DKA9_PHACE|nr:unnamed protein product [Phaedon cochleariae]
MAFNNINVKEGNRILVDKVLEQGQKLRNAMVESILKNDPFYTEVIYNNQFNTPYTSSFELTKENRDQNSTSNKERLEAFIKGECMSREDEKLALESLKSLSVPDLCKTTERSLKCSTVGSCKCCTCELYNSEYWKWNSGQKSKSSSEEAANGNHNEVTNSIRDKHKSELIQVLKFVDSLKISVNCLILNDTGQQKLLSTISDPTNWNSFSQNFFLEYTLPEILICTSHKQQLKIHSSVDKNYIRLFSRRTNDVINFKKVTLHDIERLQNIDLSCCNMQFKISFRNVRQKSTILLGYANFNFGEFLLTKNATCSRGLIVNLNDYSPISVGTLKVSLQLGCGRLYFGQEFIDAIKTSSRESIPLDSDDSTNQLVCEPEEKLVQNQKDTTKSCQKSTSTSQKASQKALGKAQSYISFTKNYENIKVDEHLKKHSHNIAITDKSIPVKKTNGSSYFEKQVEITVPEEEQVLFGFFYISEAHYLSRPINSYLTCRPFTQKETSVSQLITSSENPVFNFHQIIPLVFEDDLLARLRENYMVIEFWLKEDTTDTVIGLTKIPLHQFYLAYRNVVVLKYLMKNRLPIIGTDWWEPIYSVNNEDIVGQVQALTALGTQEQINNLKADRGFVGSFVKAQFTKPTADYRNKETKLISNKESIGIQKNLAIPNKKVIFKKVNSKLDTLDTIEKNSPNLEKGTNTSTIPVSKFDAATQSEVIMENQAEKQENNNATTKMLESFLHQLMATKPGNSHVENSTNTEPVQETNDGNSNLQHAQNKTNVELRKTSDLLESLQKALSSDNQFSSPSRHIGSTFRAMVAINNANHLPSRKKCKSRKSRSRPIKSEESVLPSCYVTFEASSEGDLKITPIVPKSTSPVWNYKCKVNLPLDLLKNGQKRLIFKVWRKSTNTVSFPNMQTDIVLGFAAVDLTVLLAGFPNVQGWFNIVDFSGKCNGQINIHVTPLDNLEIHQPRKDDCGCDIRPAAEVNEVSTSNEASESLSRALKRKFTELDEITQRLRLRLSKVTNDSDSSSDGFADEFEKDISSFRDEDNLDDFTEEVRKLNVERVAGNVDSENRMDRNSVGFEDAQKATSSSNFESEPGIACNMIDENESPVKDAGYTQIPSLNKHLLQGKQQINALLEKLTLLTADSSQNFSNRYVSGCSITNDGDGNVELIGTGTILKEFSQPSPPMSSDSLWCSPSIGNLTTKSTGTGSHFSSNSDTSLITNFSDCRPVPDGQGNTSEEKVMGNKD